MNKKPVNLVLQNARILFQNFAGTKKQFNPEGARNFCVVIPDDIAQSLIDDGWNVKELKPMEEGLPPTPYLKVNVGFGPYPPTLFMVTNQKTLLDETTVGLLDASYIVNADVIISASFYEVNGRSGYTAYVQKGYFEIEQDELDLKYQDVPLSQNGPQSYDEEF